MDDSMADMERRHNASVKLDQVQLISDTHLKTVNRLSNALRTEMKKSKELIIALEYVAENHHEGQGKFDDRVNNAIKAYMSQLNGKGLLWTEMKK